MNGDTSPLEREILTHYWCTPGPYKGGSENWTQCEHDIVNRLIVCRMLTHEDGHLAVNRQPVRLYMEALSRVPYPILTWIMPSNTDSADENRTGQTAK